MRWSGGNRQKRPNVSLPTQCRYGVARVCVVECVVKCAVECVAECVAECVVVCVVVCVVECAVECVVDCVVECVVQRGLWSRSAVPCDTCLSKRNARPLAWVRYAHISSVESLLWMKCIVEHNSTYHAKCAHVDLMHAVVRRESEVECPPVTCYLHA